MPKLSALFEYPAVSRFGRPVDSLAVNSGCSLSLNSDASLADLNWRLCTKGCSVTRKSFAAELWVDAFEPYEEDRWEFIRIRNITFWVMGIDARFSMLWADDDGEEYRDDIEPFATLSSYRRQRSKHTGEVKVVFGQHIVSHSAGVVRVGDEVEILQRRTYI